MTCRFHSHSQDLTLMMGGHHAMTGAAAWIAVTATAGHGLGLFPVNPVGTIAGALLCAGAALLAAVILGSLAAAVCGSAEDDPGHGEERCEC